jgi:hypothetical protein
MLHQLAGMAVQPLHRERYLSVGGSLLSVHHIHSLRRAYAAAAARMNKAMKHSAACRRSINFGSTLLHVQQ